MEKLKAIDDVFLELKRIGLVHQKTEFIEEWLYREKSYIRVLRHKKRCPSRIVFDKMIQKIKIYLEKYRESDTNFSQTTASELESIILKISEYDS